MLACEKLTHVRGPVLSVLGLTVTTAELTPIVPTGEPERVIKFALKLSF